MSITAQHEIEQLLIGDSAAMRRIRALIRKIAPSPIPVLIQGPTGSGKELVARALHIGSGRSGAFPVLVRLGLRLELLSWLAPGATSARWRSAAASGLVGVLPWLRAESGAGVGRERRVVEPAGAGCVAGWGPCSCRVFTGAAAFRR